MKRERLLTDIYVERAFRDQPFLILLNINDLFIALN